MNLMDYLEISAPLASAGALYLATLATTQAIGEFFGEKIKTRERLEEIVEEEAAKLKMDPRALFVELLSVEEAKKRKVKGARCRVVGYNPKNDELITEKETLEEGTINLGMVELAEGWGANRSALRHELYHIKNDHVPKEKNPLLRMAKWFYQEPAASIYGLGGIRK
jgi:hypothetical protein